VADWVLHVDLDEFLAAVEVLRRPELRGQPVVVGGDGDPTKRGVVSTASYAARAFGVHSGMPLRTAARRCPEAVFLPVDRDTYLEVSERVMSSLREFDAVVEVLGWDEAFLAVTTEDPEGLARLIQQRIREHTALESSVGIGENKLQAKLASNLGKPAGVFRLSRRNWYAVLGDRPPDALWGIGSKTARKLADLGIRTVLDLARADPAMLASRFGPTTGPWLVRLARGGDHWPVIAAPYAPRSRSRETTFQRDIADWNELRKEISRLARMVSADVAAEERLVSRVVVKIRYAPFFTQTHGEAMVAPSREPADIEAAALSALGHFAADRPVRLLGVRAEFAAAEP
jgi:nucleotidyltransferase/DNA polymerase involved in DNA repair